MATDRRITFGLNTDLPPNELGDQSMDLRNVVPASARSFRHRGGTSLVAHYASRALGRTIIVDALPEDEGEGIMVVCLNVTESAGTFTQEVHGLGEFRPSRVASDYDTVVGLEDDALFYGVVW